ncbi:MAG: TIGR02453 family protein, partial [Tabrizicola sp.]
MPYAGLPRETFAFLQGLAAQNDRDWFEAHRPDYDTYWLKAGLDLIEALGPHCATMEPRLLAVPKLNQSLRRIHRDTRFSRDKTPYQPWLHLILSTGPAFNKVPGMHIVLTPEGLGYGAGHYALDPAALDRMRQRMCDEDERAQLMAALSAAGDVQSTLDP